MMKGLYNWGIKLWKNKNIESFVIGKSQIIVFTFQFDPNKIIFNEFISKLFQLDIDLYWFTSYEEMEDNLDLFELESYAFVIITKK